MMTSVVVVRDFSSIRSDVAGTEIDVAHEYERAASVSNPGVPVQLEFVPHHRDMIAPESL